MWGIMKIYEMKYTFFFINLKLRDNTINFKNSYIKSMKTKDRLIRTNLNENYHRITTNSFIIIIKNFN